MQNFIQMSHKVQELWGLFTNSPQQAKLMLSKPPSIKNGGLHASDKGMLTCIYMQHVNKIYHVNLFTNC